MNTNKENIINKNIEVLNNIDTSNMSLKDKEWILVPITEIRRTTDKIDIIIKIVRFKTKRDPKVYGMYILDLKNDKQLLELYSLDTKEIASNFIDFQEIYFGKIIQKKLVLYDGEKIMYEEKGKISNSRIGQLFVNSGIIETSTLNNALKIQKITKEPIGRILRQMTTKISENDINYLMKMQKIKRSS